MTRRGQVVVVAAALIAVALLPMVVAYLQLGYQPAVDGGETTPVETTERVVSDALPTATAGVPDTNWTARAEVALTVRQSLWPVFTTIEDAGPPDAATRVEFNDTAAERIARTACPTGPNRAFGDCDGLAGVVVQWRGNSTHVVAVAIDIEQISAQRRTEATLVVRR